MPGEISSHRRVRGGARAPRLCAPSWLVAGLAAGLALAFSGAGCKAKEKAQPEVDIADAKVGAKTEQKKRRPMRAPAPRKGFVEMTVGGEKKRFEVLPTKANRVLPGARPPMVVVDAYPEESAGEHFKIHIQDVQLNDVAGRSLIGAGRGAERPPVIFMTYEDATGASYTGAVKAGGTANLVIEKWEPEQDRVVGTFDGTFKSSDGKELKVEGGRFQTERAS